MSNDFSFMLLSVIIKIIFNKCNVLIYSKLSLCMKIAKMKIYIGLWPSFKKKTIYWGISDMHKAWIFNVYDNKFGVKCIPLIIPMINAINTTIDTKRVVAIIVVRGHTVRNILLELYSSNPGLSQYLTLILLKYFGM